MDRTELRTRIAEMLSEVSPGTDPDEEINESLEWTGHQLRSQAKRSQFNTHAEVLRWIADRLMREAGRE